MTHEERKMAIAEALSNFLSVYTPPRSVNSDEGKAEMMGRYVDSLVNKVPLTRASEFAEMLERCFRIVGNDHEGWAWPSISEFSKAAGRLHGIHGLPRLAGRSAGGAAERDIVDARLAQLEGKAVNIPKTPKGASR